jgi:hypothetical protein
MAAHRLDPIEGKPYLSPAEVVHRLEVEFSHVERSAEAGAKHVAAMIRQFEGMMMPAGIIDAFKEFQPFAIQVVVADSPDYAEAFLSFVAMPEHGLFIGYHSDDHEQAAASLLERCREALGYQVIQL